MKQCLLFHTLSKWERLDGCRIRRYCIKDGCNEKQIIIKHDWAEWKYKSTNNCRLIRQCLGCGIEDEGDVNHEWSHWKYKNEFDCNVSRICSRCGQAESDLAHLWGDWEYENENDCSQIRVCERCKSEEIGCEKHEWEKIGFHKWICKRCNEKKTIKNYIIPFKSRSKNLGEINPNSRNIISEEKHRLRIIKDIVTAKKLERKLEQERIKRLQSISGAFKKSMLFFREDVLLDSLIVDSNIWMDDNPQYENFIIVFRFLLIQFNICYTFYGPQFDEICNIKKRTEYGESANQRSRTAINRIDKLSDQNLLQIAQINFESKNPGHVDPLLINLLLMDAKRGKSVSLLSNDVELRVRAREKLKEHNFNYYRILKMDDLDEHINNIQLAMKEDITDNVQHVAEKVIYL